MKVSSVSPKYWGIKLPVLAVRSALQLVLCLLFVCSQNVVFNVQVVVGNGLVVFDLSQ